jgi:hypothetical protein
MQILYYFIKETEHPDLGIHQRVLEPIPQDMEGQL